MPQPVTKRRSGTSILAAGALVASLVAVGARPAAAVETVADHATPVTACVGDATEDWMFDDVSQGHYFRGAINCLAYYGVTIGYGDGTFRPSRNVSRFEMVLFMERSARAAGADPADVVQDFAATGSDPVNRADMALLIARLLASATDNDSRVNVVLRSDGIFTVGGTEPDDAFIDSRQSQPLTKDSAASALFELGVAKGTGGGNFSPEGHVTRGEMAAFITRALAHTTARPEGVTVQQYLPGEVTVSVRNEVFAPVVNAAIDAFSIASRDAHRAFRSDGSCSTLVNDQSGSRSCEIDVLDPVTGPDGDFTIGLGPTDEQELTVWAWTGALGDVVRSGDDRLVSVEVSTQGVEATGAKVSNSLPENATHVRFGSTVTVTVQLVGVNGLRAVPPEDGASYTIRREAFNQIDGTGHHQQPPSRRGPPRLSRWTTPARSSSPSTGSIRIPTTPETPTTTRSCGATPSPQSTTAPSSTCRSKTCRSSSRTLIRWPPQSTCPLRSSTCGRRGRTRGRPTMW